MKITLLYQVSHYIRVKKQRNKELGPAKLPCYKEGFVISDLFITRFHCIFKVSTALHLGSEIQVEREYFVYLYMCHNGRF